jgi:hypothetical protein
MFGSNVARLGPANGQMAQMGFQYSSVRCTNSPPEEHPRLWHYRRKWSVPGGGENAFEVTIEPPGSLPRPGQQPPVCAPGSRWSSGRKDRHRPEEIAPAGAGPGRLGEKPRVSARWRRERLVDGRGHETVGCPSNESDSQSQDNRCGWGDQRPGWLNLERGGLPGGPGNPQPGRQPNPSTQRIPSAAGASSRPCLSPKIPG